MDWDHEIEVHISLMGSLTSDMDARTSIFSMSGNVRKGEEEIGNLTFEVDRAHSPQITMCHVLCMSRLRSIMERPRYVQVEYEGLLHF
jgi:hypothetical protein